MTMSPVDREGAAAPGERHAWGLPQRLRFKTERECSKCGMVKVTRHQTHENIWTQYWRNGEEKVAGKGTPPCPGRRS